jgi:alkylation response protein AidB-like acyl-CoA dehydrogenase
MDFTFSEDQVAIRDLANQIFGDHASDEKLLDFDRSGDSHDEKLWQTLAEQGLLAITLSEALGGSDLGFTELCLILEEQGRRVAPAPLYSSLVLGALPLTEFGNEAQQQRWLKALAEGKAKLSAAVAEWGMSEAFAQRVSASKDGDSYTLNGHLDMVPDAVLADMILVPAVAEDGSKTIFLVEREAAGVEVLATPTSKSKTDGRLTLNGVTVNADTVLGSVGQGQEILDWLSQRAELAICAMVTGICDEALKRTAEFTCERKQFGVPIGSFQAVAMQAADAFIDIEAIRSTYWLALFRLENGLDARAEIHCAKWWASDGGHRVVYRTQHLHGGMGADREYPIHRFFLWSKHLGMMLGGRSVQIEKLGKLLASDDSIGTAGMGL